MKRNRATSALCAQNIQAITAIAEKGAKRKRPPSARIKTLVDDQRSNWKAGELIATLEKAEFDQEIDLQDLRADLIHQLSRCLGCSAGGQQVIDQEDAAFGFHGIGMDRNRVRAVFQVIALLIGGIWKLALFA